MSEVKKKKTTNTKAKTSRRKVQASKAVSRKNLTRPAKRPAVQKKVQVEAVDTIEKIEVIKTVASPEVIIPKTDEIRTTEAMSGVVEVTPEATGASVATPETTATAPEAAVITPEITAAAPETTTASTEAVTVNGGTSRTEPVTSVRPVDVMAGSTVQRIQASPRVILHAESLTASPAEELEKAVASVTRQKTRIKVEDRDATPATAKLPETWTNESRRTRSSATMDAAMRSAALQDDDLGVLPKRTRRRKKSRIQFGFKRVALAMMCAAAAVFAIVYFVNINTPSIELKVAAMQSGIDASYPAYVPRDFSLSDITSESGKITLNFHNASTGDAFSIVEEKSAWDSNALLTNYVADAYGDNYTVIREQGLTLYISGVNATWVNGGICFKLKTTSGSLTKKQIKTIAASL